MLTAEKEKETKAKRGKKPKEKAARRDKTAGCNVGITGEAQGTSTR